MQNLRLSRPDLTTKRGKAIIVVATSAAVLVAILAVLLALGVVFSPQRAGYPYQAMKPGAPCDRTPGVWQDWASSRSDCLATGLLLRTSSSGGPYAQEAFYGPRGAKFPANYRFSVRIRDVRSGSCSGAQYELSNDPTALHYGAAHCADGSWNVGVYNSAGERVGPRWWHGPYTRAATNILTVTYDRGEQTILIDGNQVARFTDTQAQSSEFIGLGVFNAAGNPQATFSEFKIDALS